MSASRSLFFPFDKDGKGCREEGPMNLGEGGRVLETLIEKLELTPKRAVLLVALLLCLRRDLGGN